MSLTIGDLTPKLRQLIIKQDPELQEEQKSIMAELEMECQKAEFFMKQHGESASTRAIIERSRAFIRGELTPEEFLEATMKDIRQSR